MSFTGSFDAFARFECVLIKQKNPITLKNAIGFFLIKSSLTTEKTADSNWKFGCF
jgi:hypothetical protein